MQQDFSQHSLINWSGCLQMANGNLEFANELLTMFFTSLPEEQQIFCHAYEANDYLALKNAAHRMRGALAYCVMPAVDNTLKVLEHAIVNQDQVAIDAAYAVFSAQIEQLLQPG